MQGNLSLYEWIGDNTDYRVNTIEAEISAAMRTFSWKPIAFEKTVLDTWSSVNALPSANVVSSYQKLNLRRAF